MNNPFKSTQPSWSSQYGNYYGGTPQKSSKKYLIIGGIALALVAIVAVVVIVANTNTPEQAEEEAILSELIDPGEVDEQLNEHLKSIRNEITYNNYDSSEDQTSFSDVPDDYFPINLESSTSKENLIYSTAFSILADKYISPLLFEGSSVEKMASDNEISIRRINGANSNALNYYLEHESVVIIDGKGDEPFSETGELVLIYAGSPALGTYNYYSVGGLCKECSLPLTINKLDLFAALKEDDNFYVLEKERL